MLKKGIYEEIINRELGEKIEQAKDQNLVCKSQDIDEVEAPKILSQYLAHSIRKKLENIENQEDRVRFINNILLDAGLNNEMQIIPASHNLLTEVLSQEQAVIQNETHVETVRPRSGFRVSNLFTGGCSTLSLGEEIRREIVSANEICFIVSL